MWRSWVSPIGRRAVAWVLGAAVGAALGGAVGIDLPAVMFGAGFVAMAGEDLRWRRTHPPSDDWSGDPAIERVGKVLLVVGLALIASVVVVSLTTN